MKKKISEEHVLNALEGYLKAMSILDDNDLIIDIKRTRSNDYEIHVEKENS